MTLRQSVLLDTLLTALWLFLTVYGWTSPTWVYIVLTVALSLGWVCTGLLWRLGRKLDHLRGLR